MFRSSVLGLSAIVAATVAAAPASAATVYVYVDPMTLEKRSVHIDPDGPDRAYLCMLPPATSGCHRIAMRRQAG